MFLLLVLKWIITAEEGCEERFNGQIDSSTKFVKSCQNDQESVPTKNST